MQIKSFPSMIIVAISLIVFITGGCESPDSTGTGTKESGDNAHSHAGDNHSGDHAEEEHAAHGPNHGHIFDIDSSEYQAEWVKYKDNNIIRMFVLTGDAKENIAVKADSFVVTPLVGNDDGLKFELAAEEPNADGESAVYMLDDQDLSMSIPLGVKIEFSIGDKKFTGKIKAHKPLDH